MKRISSVFCALMLLVTLMAAMIVPARAVDMTFNFQGTVGETAYFIICSDEYDEILQAKIYNGVIPGMELDVAGGVTLGLAGTPTSEGEFSVFITLVTKNHGETDIRVNVTVKAAPKQDVEVSPGIPVITKHPTSESVVEGESATFVARADNVRQYVWYIAIADAEMECSELKSYIKGNIKVTGYNTERLVLENIPATLHNAYIWCRFVGAEGSVSSDAAKISIIDPKDATPIVTKDPTDETVEEGGRAVFIAKAKYAQTYLWRFVSPEGIQYDCVDAPKTFKGLKVSGADTERIVLENIPLELNGYRIYCRFTGGDSISCNMAKLYVTEKPETEPPTEAPTEAPTETPTEAPTQASTEAPEGNPSGNKTDNQKNESNKNDKGQEGAKDPDRGVSPILIILLVVASAAVGCISMFVILKLKEMKR